MLIYYLIEVKSFQLCYYVIQEAARLQMGGKMNNNDLCLPTNSMSNLVPLSGRLSKWCNVPQRGKIKKNKIILPFFLICFLIIHLYPIMITFWSNKFVGHMRLFYKKKIVTKCFQEAYYFIWCILSVRNNKKRI